MALLFFFFVPFSKLEKQELVELGEEHQNLPVKYGWLVFFFLMIILSLPREKKLVMAVVYPRGL